MTRMTGGQAVVEALLAEGVEAAFGMPAANNLHLYDALYHRPQLRHVLVRHEQAAVFAADGYAVATGRTGVAIVVGGPGVGNALTAITEANSNSIPVLVVASNVPSRFIDQGKLMPHELPGQMEIMKPVTCWRRRVTSVAEIPGAVREAMRRLATGRPQPAFLEVPSDLLSAEGKIEMPPPESFARQSGDLRTVAEAARMLAQASRPLIWAGGGCLSSGATDELLRLSGLLPAPVLTTLMGKGAVPEDYPLALGASWSAGSKVDAILRSADVLLAVGTRFSSMDTADFQAEMPANLIHVDLDPAEIGRNYAARLGIVGDARTVLRQIREAFERRKSMEGETTTGQSPNRPGLAAQVQEAVHSHLTALEQTKGQEILPMFRQLREILPPDTLLSLDSQIGIWALRFLPAHQPRTMHFPAGLGTLGYGLPAAIGMKVGSPHKPVVCITGDGGFMLSCQEMGTAMQERLALPIVICNDSGYGSLRWHQRLRFGGRYIGVDLEQPDFVAFAESFGAAALRLDSPAQLAEAVAGALSSDRPVLIEVPLKVEPPRAR